MVSDTFSPVTLLSTPERHTVRSEATGPLWRRIRSRSCPRKRVVAVSEIQFYSTGSVFMCILSAEVDDLSNGIGVKSKSN